MLKPLSKALREALARAYPDAARSHAEAGSMRVVAAGDDAIELLIYGNIGASWWDDESVTAKSVLEQLKDFAGSTINVRINSYGGSVSDGVAIHNELRRQAKAGVAINVSIDGAACSIASLIAVAGDTVSMPSNTLMMLHAPWGGLYIEGNAKLVREVSEEFASVLETFGKAMAQSYARKSGRKADEFTAMWDSGKDYWFTAEEAKAEGLCDVVIDASEQDADEEDTADEEASAALAKLFASAPAELHAGLRAAFRHPEHTAGDPPRRKASQPGTGGAHQAAPSAANSQEETDMPNPITPADTNNSANPSQDAQAAATAAITALRDRNTEVRALAEPHFDNPEIRAYYDQVIADADPAVTAADFGKQVLALLAKGRQPLNGGTPSASGGDNRVRQREGMVLAIAGRAGIAQVEAGNPFNGLTMTDMARACLNAAGVNTSGMSRMDIVGTAFTHTSSDFPGLLTGAVQRAVLAGFEEVLEPLDAFTRAVNVSDFKSSNLFGLGSFSDLDKVPEGDEYKYGTFSTQSQAIKLATYGKLFSITRQAIINDDLSVFSDVPRKMGQAAKRTIVKEVFALLVSNPTLSDGVALFHATHNNLLTAAAIATASVDLMRQAFAKQKDASGNILGYSMAGLLTPIELGGLARQVRTNEFVIDQSSKNNTQKNYLQNTFDVVDSARLTGTGWYGFANPNIQDGIVIGYLDGQQTPYLEQQQGFTVDGVAWKVRIDAAPAIADYRGLAYNPGA